MWPWTVTQHIHCIRITCSRLLSERGSVHLYTILPVRRCVVDDHAATPTRLCLLDSLTESSAQSRRRSRAPCNSTNVHRHRNVYRKPSATSFQLTTFRLNWTAKFQPSITLISINTRQARTEIGTRYTKKVNTSLKLRNDFKWCSTHNRQTLFIYLCSKSI